MDFLHCDGKATRLLEGVKKNLLNDEIVDYQVWVKFKVYKLFLSNVICLLRNFELFYSLCYNKTEIEGKN